LLIRVLRQCDDLDDDIFEELDHVARMMQATGLSHGQWPQQRMEEELSEKYPDLRDRIAQERRAKIDSIILYNKHSGSVPRGSSSYRAGSFHQHANEPPPRPRRRPSSQGSLSPASTPILKGQTPSSDFIFDMEEDDDEFNLSPVSESISEHKSSAMDISWKQMGKQRATSSTGLEDHSALLETPHTPVLANSPHAWSSVSPLSAPKLSMKDIMDQASSTRTSSLSLGLSAKSPTSRQPSGSIIQVKLSQKERKRLQQQAAHNVSSSPPELPQLPSTSSKASPWKPVPKSKAKFDDPISPAATPGRTTPALTMRQTIANPGPKSPPITKTVKTPTETPNRAHNPTSSPTPQLSSSQPAVQIKSIRHTPMPARPALDTQHLSMTDILSQQAAEKIRIQGGGEKRSLADIQAEQEFQEWWEKESARVQSEEQAKERKDNSKKNNRQHRRRGGQGKDKEKRVASSSKQ
jgi:inhibitor of Bruton tyrosine kinase